MAQEELRVLIGDDGICHIVDRSTFERLAAPIVEKAEPLAPPNLHMYARALEEAGYVVLKRETAKELFLAYQMIAALNQTKRSK